MEDFLRTISVARGEEPADLLLQNAQLVNVFSGTIERTNVAICGSTVAGIGEDYTEAEQVLDLEGRYLAPGLIDAHVHLESSLVSVPEYAKVVVPQGTTTVISDPHEIANVLGTLGIEYILRSSENLPLNVYLMASSCVPATHLETAGAALTDTDIAYLLSRDRVLGLAEMMNVPGVLFKVPEVARKLMVARTRLAIIDGHAPQLRGQALNAYLSAGVGSDHECTSADEALEKLQRGMHIMIREGSAARNLEDLLPIVNERTARRCMFVSDDRHPEDLIQEGHVNSILRKAVGLGLDPVLAIQMATLNPAEYFGLVGQGAVAPGHRADLVVFEDLRDFQVAMTLKDGQVVAQEGKLLVDVPAYDDPNVRDTMHMAPVTAEQLQVKAHGDQVRVIGLIPHQIVTRALTLPITPDAEGNIPYDLERDLLKLVVVERHHATGNVGVGWVQGFGLKRGALASSVAHDSHNVIVVGTNDADILAALEEMQRIRGGFVVVADGQVIGTLPLPIAGLMSSSPVEEVHAQLQRLLEAARELGCQVDNPFITLSFLALPVIPELKLTDRGLVDVNRFDFVDVSDESEA